MFQHKINLSYYIWEVKKKFGIDPILEWEIVKRYSNYKEGIDIFLYVLKN